MINQNPIKVDVGTVSGYTINKSQTLGGLTNPITNAFIYFVGTKTLTGNFVVDFNEDTYVIGDSVGLWFTSAITNSSPEASTLTINGVDFTSLIVTGSAVDIFVELKYSGTSWYVENENQLIESLIPSLSGYAPLASPNFTGTPTTPTVSGSSDSSTKIASTAFVQQVVAALNIGNYALLASPAFTGNPTATTQAYSDNTTNIATTAMVQAAITYLKANLTQPKILGSSAIGAVTLGTGAGTGASYTITGNDISFQISITTGTGCATAASICQVAFGIAYAGSPRAFIQSRSATAVALASAAQPYPSETTTYVALISGGTALADSTTYVFNVLIAS